jgi:predicted nucleic acid-binding protein
MRLYLDNCCLQRPLDDQTHPRIRVETEAVFAILAAIQSGDHQLINSEALEYEIGRIPDSDRRAEVISVLTLASERLEISDDIEAAALAFEHGGIRAMDAIHLALASTAEVDYFCTCDDALFRKAQVLAGLNCKVITLLGLVPEVTK